MEWKTGRIEISGTIGAPTNSTIMTIGANPNGSTTFTDYFKGNVYTAAVYSGALSATNVKTNAMAGIAMAGGAVSSSTLKYTIIWNENLESGTFTTDDITVTNGTKGTFTEVTANRVYSISVTTASNQNNTQKITINPNACEDTAGNENDSSISSSVLIEKVKPAYTYLSVTNNTTGNNKYVRTSESLTVSFKMTDTNILTDFLTKDDIEVVVGSSTITIDSSKKTLTSTISSDKKTITYVYTVTGITGNGIVSLNIPAGKVADSAGNISAIKTIALHTVATDETSDQTTADNNGPTCLIESNPSSGPTNASTITYTFTFTEDVTGFTADDITVTNGTKGTLNGSGSVYTMDVSTIRTGNTTQTVSVAAGVCTDLAGNGNIVSVPSTYSIDVDPIKPTCAISIDSVTPTTANTTSPTNASSITYKFTFSEDVTDFAADDITVTNGTKGTLSGSGSVYTMTISTVTTANTTQKVSVAAGKCTDAAGNSNTASNSFSINVDPIKPTCSISIDSVEPSTANTSSPTNANSITYKFTFSEDVTGFTADDITVTNGTKGTLSGSGSVYTMKISTVTTANTTQKVSVAAGKCTDAAGNGNTASNSFSINVDPIKPTCVISIDSVTPSTANTTGPTNASSITYKFTFSEDVTDFTADDITVTNGTKGTLSGSGSTYTMSIATNSNKEQTQTVSVAAGLCTDAAGNGNVASAPDYDSSNPSPYSIEIDTKVPVFTFDSVDRSYVNSSDTLTVKFHVTDANVITNSLGKDNIEIKVAGTTKTIASGNKTLTVTPNSTNKRIDYTFTVKGITGDGKVSLAYPASMITDSVGNKNSAKTITLYTVATDTTSAQTIADNTLPTVTVSPVSDSNYTKTKNVTITIEDPVVNESNSGLSSNTGSYFISNTEPPSGTLVSYTSGTPITIGEGLTGEYYLYVKQITDKEGNSSSDSHIVTIETGASAGTYHKYGPYKFDNTAPTVTVTPSSSTTWSKTKTITIRMADSNSGIKNETDSPREYFVATSSNPGNTENAASSDKSVTSFTGDTTTFTIGSSPSLSGKYYLFVRQIKDEAENTSTNGTDIVTIGGVTYQRYGVYWIDNTKPTVSLTATNSSVYSKTKSIKITYKDSHSGASSTSGTYFVSLSDNPENTTNAASSDGSVGPFTVSSTTSGTATFTIGNEPDLTGMYYIYVKQIKDNVELTSSGGTIKTVGGESYHRFGPFKFDNTEPTVTVSPNSDTTPTQSKNVTITLADSDSGVKSDTPKEYFLMPNTGSTPTSINNAETSDGSVKTYTSGEEVIIGTGLTGDYYLYVRQISDSVAESTKNTSTSTNYLTISGVTYHRYGPYSFDNTSPTITVSPISSTTWTKKKNITVTISDDKSGLNSTTGEYFVTTEETPGDTTNAASSDGTVGTYISGTQFTIGVSPILSGQYYLFVKQITDNAGNKSTSTNSVTIGTGDSAVTYHRYGHFNIDNVNPIITVSPSIDKTYTQSKNIEITITETDSGISSSSVKEFFVSDSETVTNLITYTSGGTNTINGLTGEYYVYVRQISDNVSLTSSGGTLVAISGVNYHKFGPYWFDNTKPTITLDNSSDSTPTQTKDVKISLADIPTNSGVKSATDSPRQYFLTTETAPTSINNANETISTTLSTYTSDTEFTIGQNANKLTGTYYLYVRQVFDVANNGSDQTSASSLGDITINSVVYHKYGPYVFDNTIPTCGIAVNKTSPTNAEKLIYTFTWSEDVTGFETSDITVTNGTKGIFTEVTANRVYTLEVETSETQNNEQQIVTIAKNAVVDIASNGNEETSNDDMFIDRVKPIYGYGGVANVTTGNNKYVKQSDELQATWTFTDKNTMSSDVSVDDIEILLINPNTNTETNLNTPGTTILRKLTSSQTTINGDKVITYILTINEDEKEDGGIYGDGILEFRFPAEKVTDTAGNSNNKQKIQTFIEVNNESSDEVKADNTIPTITVNSSTDTTTPTQTKNITITLDDPISNGVNSGVRDATSSPRQYFLTTETAPIAIENMASSTTTVCSTYTSGTEFTVGQTPTKLTGDYYLYVRQILDNAGNASSTTDYITIGGVVYHKYHIGIIDNTQPSAIINTQSEYVTTNLVTRLDAINNNNGEHSSSTTTWKDISGNNNNGTIKDGTWGENYLTFNGTSTVVKLPEMNSNYQTIQVTFSMPEVPTSVQYLMGNWQTGGGGIYINSAGYICGEYYIGGAWKSVKSTARIIANQKYDVALTYDGSNIIIYIDGNEDGRTSVTGTIGAPTNSTIMTIGANPNGSTTFTEFFKGNIYTAAVYFSALSAANVKTNAEAGMAMAGGATNRESINYTILWSETLADGTFTKDDISITGGTLGTLSTVTSNRKYTITATTSELQDSNQVISIPASKCTDIAGNDNIATSRTVAIDRVAPTCSISIDGVEPSTAKKTSTTNAESITYKFQWSENVTGFNANDISVTNGTKGTFSGSESTYTLVVNTIADRNTTQTIGVNTNGCYDAATNFNIVPTPSSIKVDRVLPTISASPAIEESYTKKKNIVITQTDPTVGDLASGVSSSSGEYFVANTETPTVTTNAASSTGSVGTFTTDSEGKATITIGETPEITGIYYLFVKQITDNAGNASTTDGTVEINETKYQKFGPYKFDNTLPTVSATPSSDSTYTKTKSISISLADADSGLGDSITREWFMTLDNNDTPSVPETTANAAISGGAVGTFTGDNTTITVGASPALTGTYYLYVRQITDKMLNTSEGGTAIVTVGGVNYHRFGPFNFDNVIPTITVNPSSNNPGDFSKSKTISITHADDTSGVDGNTGKYFVTNSITPTSTTNAAVSGGAVSEYTTTGGVASITFGASPALTGTYYLFIKQITDIATNASSSADFVTIGEVTYHRYGPYYIDNTSPTCSITAKDTNTGAEITSGPTKTTSITYTFTWSDNWDSDYSEILADGTFTASDISVTNGTADTSTFTEVEKNKKYTMVVNTNNNVEETQTISIAAGECTDIAGNNNTTATKSIVVDRLAPQFTLDSFKNNTTNNNYYVKSTDSFTIKFHVIDAHEITNSLEKDNSSNNNKYIKILVGGTELTSIPSANKTLTATPSTDNKRIDYTYTVTGITGDGTLSFAYTQNSILDSLGNTSGQTITLPTHATDPSPSETIADNTLPTMTLSEESNTTYTKTKSITITLADPVAGTVNSKLASTTGEYFLTTEEVPTVTTNAASSTGAIGTYTSGTPFTIGQSPDLTGEYYMFVRQVFDKAGNGTATQTGDVTINGIVYHKYGQYYFDNTAPTITVNPSSSNTWSRVKDITISLNDTKSGVDTANVTKEYFVTTLSDPTEISNLANETRTSVNTYTHNEQFTIGESPVFSGNVYLYVRQIEDEAGNVSTKQTGDVTINDIVYHRYGTYWVDNTKPTVGLSATNSGVYSKTKNVTITYTDSHSGASSTSGTYFVTKSSAPSNTTNAASSDGTVGTFTVNSATSGTATFTIGNEPDLTGIYYIYVKQITDNVALTSSGGTIITVGGESYHQFGPFKFDNTVPTVTVSPNSDDTATQTKSLTISIADSDSGLNSSISKQYFLRAEKDTRTDAIYNAETSDGSAKTYTISNETKNSDEKVTEGTGSITIGTGLTGDYYLYVRQISDSVAETNKNVSTNTDVTIGGVVYHRYGLYSFDNTNPTITANPAEEKTKTWTRTKDITVTLSDDKSGLASNTGSYFITTSASATAAGTLKTFTVDSSTGEGTITLGNNLTGIYYVYVKQITDKAGNGSSDSYTVTVGTDTYQKYGPYYLDNIKPTFSVTPTTDTTYTQTKNITIVAEDEHSGVSNSSTKEFFITKNSETTVIDNENETNRTTLSTYTSGTSITLGQNATPLTGTYYLFVKQIQDNVELTSTGGTLKTVDGTSYHMYGPYNFDNQEPTINVSPSNDTTYTQTKNVTITIDDELSGIDTDITKQYFVTQNENPTTIDNQVSSDTSVCSTYTSGEEFTIGQSPRMLTGIYYLYVRQITDEAGNVQTNTDVVTIGGIKYQKFGSYYFDNTNPEISVNPSSSTDSWSRSKTINITLTDDDSRIDDSTQKEYFVSKDINPTSISNLANTTSSSVNTYTTNSSGVAQITIGDSPQITGKVYLFVRQIEDNAENKSTNGTDVVTIGGVTYQRYGQYYLDNTNPTLTVNPTTGTTYTQTKDITLTIGDTDSGLSSSSTTEFFLTTNSSTTVIDNENETNKTTLSTYTSGETFTLGQNAEPLTGTYYLFIKQVSDNVGLTTSGGTIKTIGGVNYNMYGPYKFDNSAPAVTVVPTSSTTKPEQTLGITVTWSDIHSGVVPGTKSEFFITQESNPTAIDNANETDANKTKLTTYSSGTEFTIGQNNGKMLTGAYYLFISEMKDNAGNILPGESITINGTTYHKYGPYYLDNTSPTCNISITSATPSTASKTGPTNATNLTYTFEWSDDWSDEFVLADNSFTADDITVTNGTKGTFTEVTKNKKYTLVVNTNSNVEETQTVSLIANGCEDKAGNKNKAQDPVNIEIDTKVPEYHLTSVNSKYVNDDDKLVVQFYVTDANDITNSLGKDDIKIYVAGTELTTISSANKELTSTTSIEAGTNRKRVDYTFTINKDELTGGGITGDGIISLVYPSGNISDSVGNTKSQTITLYTEADNTSSDQTIADNTLPTITVNPSSSTSTWATSKDITITLADPVAGGVNSKLDSENNQLQYFITKNPKPTTIENDASSNKTTVSPYTSGNGFEIGQSPEKLTGIYYLYVRQIFDNEGNGSQVGTDDVTINNVVYHRYGPYKLDNTNPTITVTPSNYSVEPSKKVDITVDLNDTNSGVSSETGEFFINTSDSATSIDNANETTANKSKLSSFTNGTQFSIGQTANKLTGIYYLYVKQISDNAGNKSDMNTSDGDVTIGTTNFHRYGPYYLDNTSPTCNISVTKAEPSTASKTGPTNAEKLTYTFEWSDDWGDEFILKDNSFTADDITVTNGTKGTFTEVTKNKKYTLVVETNSNVEETQTVELAENACTDVAGNIAGNVNASPNPFNIEIDTKSPVYTFDSVDKNYINSSDVLTVKFHVTDANIISNSLGKDDIEIYVAGSKETIATENKTLTVTPSSDNKRIDYTYTVKGVTGDGIVNLAYPANKISDYVGNLNIAQTITLPTHANPNPSEYENVIVDNTLPTITLDKTQDTTPSQTKSIEITFADPVVNTVNSKVTSNEGKFFINTSNSPTSIDNANETINTNLSTFTTNETTGKATITIGQTANALTGIYYLYVQQISDTAGNKSQVKTTDVTIGTTIYHRYGPYYLDNTKPTIALDKTSDETPSQTKSIEITFEDPVVNSVSSGLTSNEGKFFITTSGKATAIDNANETTTNKTKLSTFTTNATTGKATITIGQTASKLTGKYYLYIQQISDNAENKSQVATDDVTIGTTVYHRYGPYYLDNTNPTITVNPSSATTPVKTVDITVTNSDPTVGSVTSGFESNEGSYFITTSNNPTSINNANSSDNTKLSTYTSGTTFTIGQTAQNLTGTYYLFVKQISDKSGNNSTNGSDIVTIGTDVYQRYGPYKLDNNAPTCEITLVSVEPSTASKTSPTNAQKLTYRFTWSDDWGNEFVLKNGTFTADDITVTNGIKSTFTEEVANKQYTLVVETEDDQNNTQYVQIANGVCTDVAENENAEVNYNNGNGIIVDRVNPEYKYMGVLNTTTNNNKFVKNTDTLQVTFSYEDVNDLMSNNELTNNLNPNNIQVYVDSNNVTSQIPETYTDSGGNTKTVKSLTSILSTDETTGKKTITYTFTIDGGEDGKGIPGDGVLSLEIPEGLVVDKAKNTNTKQKIDLFTEVNNTSSDKTIADNTIPKCEITIDEIEPEGARKTGFTNASKIKYKFEWSERLKDGSFTIDDINVTNGIVGEFATIEENKIYTLIVETSEGQDNTQKIEVPAGACKDLAENDNTEASYSIAIDRLKPEIELNTVVNQSTGNNSYVKSADTLVVTFTGKDTHNLTDSLDKEDIQLLVNDEVIEISSANKNLTKVDSGNTITYTYTVTGITGNGQVTLKIPENKIQDEATNKNDLTTLNLNVIADNIAPTCTISVNKPNPTNASEITYTFEWSEKVTGFDETKVSLTNGTIKTFTEVTSKLKYTLTVSTEDGQDNTQTIALAEGACTDVAGNNSISAGNNIEVDRVNPKFKYVSVENSSTGNNKYVRSGETLTVTFTAKDETTGNEDTHNITNNLSKDDIKILAGGSEITIDSSNKTLTATQSEDDEKEITYVYTVTGITGNGKVSLLIPEGKITDRATNQNANTTMTLYTEANPPEDQTIADNIKPSIEYEYSNTTIDTTNKNVTIVFDVKDENYNSNTLIEDGNPNWSKLTIKIGNVEPDWTKVTRSLTKETIEKGERYTLTLSNLDMGDGMEYSGNTTILIAKDTITDLAGNTNDAQTITVGIDTPSTSDGHTSAQVVDVTSPIWTASNITKSGGNVTVDLTAKDKYFTSESLAVDNTDLTKNKIRVIIDGEDVTSKITKTLGAAQDYKESGTKYGVKHVLTLSNFEEAAIQTGKNYLEYSGDIQIIIEEGTIKDSRNNTNIETTFDLGYTDFIKPKVYKVSSSKSQSNKTATLVFDVVDKYFDTSSITEKSIKVYVDGEETTYIGKSLTSTPLYETRDGVQVQYGVRYTLELSDFKESRTSINYSREYTDWSGKVTVKIKDGTVIDKAGNYNSGSELDV